MPKAVKLLVVLLFAVSAMGAGVDKDHLNKYGKGIIEDYSDMREDDDVEWLWMASGVKLHDYRFEVKPFQNLTATTDRNMEETFDAELPRTLARVGAKNEQAPVLAVEGAVYWAQRANRAKWWIPYAGMHLAQAGVGIELVFRNEQGEIVAKLRHSGREGDNLENAAEELIDDVAKFVRAN